MYIRIPNFNSLLSVTNFKSIAQVVYELRAFDICTLRLGCRHFAENVSL